MHEADSKHDVFHAIYLGDCVLTRHSGSKDLLDVVVRDVTNDGDKNLCVVYSKKKTCWHVSTADSIIASLLGMKLI